MGMYFQLRQISFLRLAVPFITGIITGIYAQTNIPVWLSAVSIAFIFFAVVFSSKLSGYKHLWINGLAITLSFFMTGFLWSTANKAVNQHNYFEKLTTENSILIIEIDEPLQEKERSMKTTALIKTVVNGSEQNAVAGRLQLYFSKSDSLLDIQYGDVVLIPFKKLQKINAPKNPYEFDYSAFMAFKQIHHQVFLRKGDYEILEREHGNFLLKYIYESRAYLVSVLKQYLTDRQSFSIASSLLLGAYETLDFHLVRAYSSTGAMHVLAVSGLHVAILYIIIEKLLFFMSGNRRTELTRAVLIVVITWMYALLTGFSPSVQRSAIMFTFITIGKQSGRGYNIYNVLAASAIFQLLINPFMVMEVGFQLSYMAVSGIVMFQNFFYNLLYIKNKILDYLWQITSVSIAAQLITFPMGLLYFYQFPVYFFISNLFVIPISFVIMIAGAAFLVLHQIPVCAEILGKLLDILIVLMNKSVFLTEALPYSLIQGLSVSIFESWLIYAMILLFFAYIHIKNAKIIITMLAVVAILMSINTIESYFQYRQRKIVVYATPKHYAYDFIKGKENLLIADKNLTENYSQMQFYIMHNWWENDIRQHHETAFYNTLHTDTFGKLQQHKNYIYFCGKKLGIIDKPLPDIVPDKKLPLDIVILKNDAKVTLEKVQQHYFATIIVADGSNTKRSLKKWKAQADSMKIKFTDVAENGAFIQEL